MHPVVVGLLMVSHCCGGEVKRKVRIEIVLESVSSDSEFPNTIVRLCISVAQDRLLGCYCGVCGGMGSESRRTVWL